ncbi:FAD-dependent monooxygenase [Nocardia salmonicida]|uniref:FAD-dependent monooxygenase n=1 Tax=Nocardia salmonicida TaxID=53431 RepID=UPI00344678E9
MVRGASWEQILPCNSWSAGATIDSDITTAQRWGRAPPLVLTPGAVGVEWTEETVISTNTSEQTSWHAATLIVGGSLGGLTTALALAASGRAVTVLERTGGRTQRGVAILVSGASLRRALGSRAREIVGKALGPASMRQGVYPHSWWDVYSALRDAADAEPLITVVENAHVAEVGQNDAAAWARVEDGSVWTTDVLLGADGYRSVVRRQVDSARPVADYAGYVVWLGQSELSQSYVERVGGPDFFSGEDDMLAVYPLIDRDGGVTRYGWGWFDPHHTSLFRRIGAIDGAEVKYTPRVNAVPGEVYDEMIRAAETRWPEPWRTGVVEAFRARDVVATPITEYLPHRVVNGRIGVLGDAAHAQTPMTGAGFEEAVADAVALAEALDGVGAEQGLERYEAARLAGMRSRVSAGQSFSRSFAES